MQIIVHIIDNSWTTLFGSLSWCVYQNIRGLRIINFPKSSSPSLYHCVRFWFFRLILAISFDFLRISSFIWLGVGITLLVFLVGVGCLSKLMEILGEFLVVVTLLNTSFRFVLLVFDQVTKHSFFVMIRLFFRLIHTRLLYLFTISNISLSNDINILMDNNLIMSKLIIFRSRISGRTILINLFF